MEKSIERKRQFLRDYAKGCVKHGIDTSRMSLAEKKVLLKLIRAAKQENQSRASVNDLREIASIVLTPEEMTLAETVLPKVKLVITL